MPCSIERSAKAIIMTRNTMLDAAPCYAERGLLAVPAQVRRKAEARSLVRREGERRSMGYTKDPDEIRAYWKRWSNAAIGLRLARSTASRRRHRFES